MTDSYVVVFPSEFAQNMMPLLASNVRAALKTKELLFDSIGRDGPVITVKARDPVFASSAISMLFGIRRVAIAVRTEYDYHTILNEMAEIGSRLLLAGERFLVRVEGAAKGFVTKDLETAAIAAIIQKGHGSKPGTDKRHDKLLYTFLARNSAYVCIFLDEGLGGMPYGCRGSAVCPIFNELSAISALETVRQGYSARIIICYRKKSQLLDLAKMASRIIPRMNEKQVELEIYQVSGGTRTPLPMEIALNVAKEHGIKHVSLPASPLIHKSDYIDEMISRTVSQNLAPVLPLGGMDGGLYRAAREIGLERYLTRIRSLGRASGAGSLQDALKSKRSITLRAGPNILHDMLDSCRT